MKKISFLLFVFLLTAACIKGGNNISAKKKNVETYVDDPLASLQWFHDVIGSPAVWAQGNKASSLYISVVDDGLELAHPDLSANIATGWSHNYEAGVSDDTDPTPIAVDDGHGTSVAGLIAARDGNGIGVRGVAPRAKLMGFNLLSSRVVADTLKEQDALTRLTTVVAISNNSWGFPDDLGTFDSPTQTWEAAIETGLTYGRGAKGTIYLVAAGNGGRTVDLSNYDGRANFYGVIPVCGIGDDDKVVNYSEAGANLWVCAPTMRLGANVGMVTTDLVGVPGFNTDQTSTDLSDKSYTKYFAGTSASTPVLSGVVALMLEANPNLTWRDVKWILAKTARKNDPSSLYWTTNAASIPVSDYHGFGAVSATAAVATAKTWTNLASEITTTASSTSFNICSDADCISSSSGTTIDEAGHEVRSTLSLAGTGISHIEYIEVTVNLTHPHWGNLWMSLERVGGTTSQSTLSRSHQCDDGSGNTTPCTVASNSFRFGTSHHLDEAADGTWMLRVLDNATPDTYTGTMTSWTMRVRGH